VRSDPASYTFALSDNEAKERARDWRDEDPFLDVKPALLSQQHIKDYVRVTGMLWPFEHQNEERLKAASYEAWPIRFIRWDEDGRKIVDDLRENYEKYKEEGYRLERNSITFMEIDTDIRLPTYIALRFNLSITHVHRGLLLGTGPLVDPGFDGNLLIPIHNLTSAPYNINRGVIWFEFTKTSGPTTLPGHFKKRKINVRSETYFERASGNNPIQSANLETQKTANEAKAEARKATKTNTFFASLGFLAILGMILAAVSFGVSVIRDANKALAETEVLKNQAEALRKDLQEAIRKSSEDQRNLQNRIELLEPRPAGRSVPGHN
jgi:deoxycytidine triphosphate deaminase